MCLIRYTRNEPFFNILDDFFPARDHRNFSSFNTDKHVRVQDFDDRTEISVAAPGLNKEVFKVDLANSVLTVGYTTEGDTTPFFTQGSFSRSWRVDREATSEDVSATYENGVLVVTVNKVATPEASVTSITVN